MDRILFKASCYQSVERLGQFERVARRLYGAAPGDAAGKWVPGRLLNGDQTHQGRHIRLAPGAFQIQRVKLYRYR